MQVPVEVFFLHSIQFATLGDTSDSCPIQLVKHNIFFPDQACLSYNFKLNLFKRPKIMFLSHCNCFCAFFGFNQLFCFRASLSFDCLRHRTFGCSLKRQFFANDELPGSYNINIIGLISIFIVQHFASKEIRNFFEIINHLLFRREAERF